MLSRSPRLCSSALSLLALLPLSACGIYVLPESDTDGPATDSAATDPGGPGGTDTDGVATTPDEPTGDLPTTGDGTPGEPGACDFPGAVQPIFTASCGCHGGGQPAAGLSLAAGEAHADLVDVDSVGLPGTLRVAPGDPAGSFLLQKLQPDPPQGERMPIGGALSSAQIDVIAAWISAGAPETAEFACAGAAGGDVGEVEIDVRGPVQVQVGEIVELAALVTTPEGEPIADPALTWTSSGELTLYVDAKGALLGVSPGTVQLTASAGGVDSAPIDVEVVAHDPPAATFAEVRGVTDLRCATSGCHVDGVEPGDLRFDRPADKLWEELIEDESEQVPSLARVAPNAPTESYLIHKLVQRAPAVGAQMPIGGAPMPAAQVQVILRWILDGAPFN